MKSELKAIFPISKPLTDYMMGDVKDFFKRYADRTNATMRVIYMGDVLFDNIPEDYVSMLEEE